MVDTVRGKLRVRAWPKKRGRPKSRHTRYMNQWFAQAQRDLKYVDAPQMTWAMDQAKGSGLYPRDVLLKASAGGLFVIPDPEFGPLQHKRQGLYEVSFQGAILQQTSAQSLTSGVFTNVTYPLPLLDTAGLYDAGPPVGFLIPAGVNVVNLTAVQGLSGGGVATNWCYIYKNQSEVWASNESGRANTKYAMCSTGPIQVVEGDFFAHQAQVQANASTFTPTTRFMIELLDVTFPNVS